LREYQELVEQSVNPLNLTNDDLSLMIHNNGQMIGYSNRVLIEDIDLDISKNIDLNLLKYSKEVAILLYTHPDSSTAFISNLIKNLSEYIPSNVGVKLGTYFTASLPNDYVEYRMIVTGIRNI